MFDLDKLGWLNGHYLRELSVPDVAGRITEHLVRAGCCRPSRPRSRSPWCSPRRRSSTSGCRCSPRPRGCWASCSWTTPSSASTRTTPRRCSTPDARPALEAAIAALSDLATWGREEIQAALRAALVEGLGLKPKVAFGAVRVAVTGRRVSPPLFESMELLGRDRSLDRLRAALAIADE